MHSSSVVLGTWWVNQFPHIWYGPCCLANPRLQTTPAWEQINPFLTIIGTGLKAIFKHIHNCNLKCFAFSSQVPERASEGRVKAENRKDVENVCEQSLELISSMPAKAQGGMQCRSREPAVTASAGDRRNNLRLLITSLCMPLLYFDGMFIPNFFAWT